MKTIVSTQLSYEFIKELESLIDKNQSSLCIDLNNYKFIVVKENDYNAWQETSYLLSSLKNAELLKKAIDEPLDECKDLDNDDMSETISIQIPQR